MTDNFYLKDLIRRVRAELDAAEKAREIAGEEIKYTLGSITLEVNFVVEESHGAEGGVDLKVIKFGGKEAKASTAVQKITVQLLPAHAGAGGGSFFLQNPQGPGTSTPPPGSTPPTKGFSEI